MDRFGFHKCPALRVAICLIIGIVIGRSVEVPPLVVLALCGILCCLVGALLFLSPRSRRINSLISLCVLVDCVGIGAGRITSDLRSTSALPEGFLRDPVIIRGRITDVSSTKDHRTRCILAGSALFHSFKKYSFPFSVMVTVTPSRADTAQTVLRYGMEGAFEGVLSRPPGERNPGEFSMRKYYEANGISFLVMVRGFDHVAVLDSSGGSWLMRRVVVPARQHILAVISGTIKGEEGEFLKGLLIGERGGLSASTRAAFTNAGVAHVLAVSGSNVAVVAGVLLGLLEFLRLPRFMRLLAAIAGLLLFMLVSGSQPPVARATVMALVFLPGSFVEEKPNTYNSLGLAALIILLLDARQLFDVGFQLSFVAVLSLIHLYPIVNQSISSLSGRALWNRALLWTLRVCVLSAVATLGTLPLTAVYFGKVSIIGLLANILVIPAVGVSVALGSVSVLAGIFSLWLADVYAALNSILLRLTLAFTDLAGNLPCATLDAFRFRPIDACPFYIGLALLFHLKPPPVARILFIGLLVALNVASFYPDTAVTASRPGTLRVSFIDVGQGDAVLLELPTHKTMLIDAGPRTEDFDAGERIVAPFLKRRGISTLDILLVSHPDADHLGGVLGVLRAFEVGQVVDNGQVSQSEMYRSYIHELSRKESAVLHVRAGMSIMDGGGSRVYVLSPADVPSDTLRQEASLNNTSVVVKVQYGSVSFLLGGDAAEAAEREMVGAYGDFLRSTVLKVGHHGSSTSTSQGFVDAVEPAYGIISVGRFNRFRHPSPRVLRLLRDAHVTLLRTDEAGAIILETDGRTLTVVDWRQEP